MDRCETPNHACGQGRSEASILEKVTPYLDSAYDWLLYPRRLSVASGPRNYLCRVYRPSVYCDGTCHLTGKGLAVNLLELLMNVV